MLALCTIQVVLRYVFNSPLVWSDEVILIMLAWFSYPALVFNIWKDNHFHISSFYEKMPVGLQIVCDLVRHILTGVFCLLLGYFGWKLMLQYWPLPYTASRLPQGMRYVPVVFGGFCSTLFCISNIFGTFIDRPGKAPVSKDAANKEGVN